jgi:hypothetical protein
VFVHAVIKLQLLLHGDPGDHCGGGQGGGQELAGREALELVDSFSNGQDEANTEQFPRGIN